MLKNVDNCKEKTNDLKTISDLKLDATYISGKYVSMFYDRV